MKRKPAVDASATPKGGPVAETLMTRDANGVVVASGITFTVPPTRSALGFFNGADIHNGDVFNENGWVTNPRRAPRKWFEPIYDSGCYDERNKGKVWPPKLCWENITALESLAYRAERYRRAHYLLKWKLLVSRMEAAGKFRGIVLNDPGYVAAGHVYFEVIARGIICSRQEEYERDYKAKFEGFSVPYLELPLNQDLTDQWFAYDKRSRTLGRRALKAERAFKGALLEHCRNHEMKDSSLYDPSTTQFCLYRFAAETAEPRTYLVGFSRTGDSIKLDVLSSFSGIKEVNVEAVTWQPPQPNQ
jgi:hypothetical protein